MAALLASEDRGASPQNLRVLGAEGEGERGAVPPQRDKQRPKYNLGSSLQEADQVKVLKMLEDNEDRFAFSLEDMRPTDFKGEAMEINLNSDKAIFRPPHKLGQVEWDFVAKQCRQLETLGFIHKSTQSTYASATVVVRKKNSEGNYTDFR